MATVTCATDWYSGARSASSASTLPGRSATSSKWPAPIAAGAFHDHVRSRFQIDDHAAFPQHTAVVFAQNRPAAGCQHHAGLRRGFLDDRLFAIAEAVLAFHVEDPRDVRAGALLHQLIGVLEVEAQGRREFAADGRLAGSHHAY